MEREEILKKLYQINRAIEVTRACGEEVTKELSAYSTAVFWVWYLTDVNPNVLGRGRLENWLKIIEDFEREHADDQ